PLAQRQQQRQPLRQKLPLPPQLQRTLINRRGILQYTRLLFDIETKLCHIDIVVSSN
ncbi:unnamed protein product, partial [Rotaria magnacalcarata]